MPQNPSYSTSSSRNERLAIGNLSDRDKFTSFLSFNHIVFSRIFPSFLFVNLDLSLLFFLKIYMVSISI